MRFIALVVLALVAVASCGSNDASGDADSAPTNVVRTPLTGTRWALSAATDLGVPTRGVAVTAEFAASRVSGNSGCNGYHAPYEAERSSLTIGPEIAGTQMACQPRPTAVEKEYLKRLSQVESYELADKTLTLFGKNDRALLVYDASGGADAIAGKWTATAYYSGAVVQSVIAGSKLTANFDDGQVSGDGGCNLFNGSYKVTGTAITMGPFSSTLRACVDVALQNQEQQYLATLQLSAKYRVAGDRLELLRGDDGVAATFEKTSAPG